MTKKQKKELDKYAENWIDEIGQYINPHIIKTLLQDGARWYEEIINETLKKNA